MLHLPVAAGLLTVATGLHGQEALRNAIEGDRSYAARSQRSTESPLPVSWGPVSFSVGAGLNLMYDDNVLLRETNEEEDFIISPGVNVGVYYPITERTRLSLNVGLSYDIYTQNVRDDRFSISQTSASEVALDFEFGRSLITIYDRFSYSQDLLDEGEARSSGNYGGFNNTAGIRAYWVPEPLLVEGGYSWNLFLSTDDEFNDLDRTSHQVFARIGQILQERTRWGVETSGSLTIYEEPLRNDFTSVSVGPYLEWQVTEAINLNLRGGWSWTMFDDNGLLPTPDDLSVPYMAMQASHQLTAYFSHSLTAVREVRVGINTQYIEVFNIRYGASWQLTDIISLRAGAFYEKGEEPSFLFTEEFDRFGFDLGLPFQLTDHLSLSVGYRFTTRESNVDGRDYDNNRANLNFSYRF